MVPGVDTIIMFLTHMVTTVTIKITITTIGQQMEAFLGTILILAILTIQLAMNIGTTYKLTIHSTVIILELIGTIFVIHLKTIHNLMMEITIGIP